MDSDSKVAYIGKTRDYIITDASEVREVAHRRTITVGDEIEGVRIGAIKCSFHWRDASHGNEQYMWRGRWSCMAGRNRDELENAVARDGKKRFDYLYVKPLSLD